MLAALLCSCFLVTLAAAINPQPYTVWNQSFFNDGHRHNAINSDHPIAIGKDLVYIFSPRAIYSLDRRTGNNGSFYYELSAAPSYVDVNAKGSRLVACQQTGALYFAYNHTVYGFLDGKTPVPSWKAEIMRAPSGGAVLQDGILMIMTGDSHVDVYDPQTGRLLWLYAANHFDNGEATVAAFGVAVVADQSGRKLFGLNSSTGEYLWNQTFPSTIQCSPVLSASGEKVLVATSGTYSFTIHIMEITTGAIFTVGSHPYQNSDYNNYGPPLQLQVDSEDVVFLNTENSEYVMNLTAGLPLLWYETVASILRRFHGKRLLSLYRYQDYAQLRLEGIEKRSGYRDWTMEFDKSHMHNPIFITASDDSDWIYIAATFNKQQTYGAYVTIDAIRAPPASSITMTKCTDSQCHTGCQNVTFKQGCFAQDPSIEASGSKNWTSFICASSTEYQWSLVQGTSCGQATAHGVYKTEQYQGQCAIGHYLKSSILLACGSGN